MQNQGFPIKEVVPEPKRPLLGFTEQMGGLKRGAKRAGKEDRIKESESRPHDLTSESFIVKQAQKR